MKDKWYGDNRDLVKWGVLLELSKQHRAGRRDAYMQEVKGILAELVSLDSPCIIFLDPDTGIQTKSPKLEHVLNSELKQIWDAMRGNDLLVFYQHKSHETNWVEPRREQFRSALGLSSGTAKRAGSTAAPDVVFFFAKKPLFIGTGR